MNVNEQQAAMQQNKVTEEPMCNTSPDSVAVVKSMVNRSIQSEISYRSSITVECDNGVVTLRGIFANAKDKNSALRAAISNPCVGKVINEASLTTD